MPVQKMYKQDHGTFDADNVNVTWVETLLRELLNSQPSELVERSGKVIALCSQHIFTDTIIIGVKTRSEIIFLFVHMFLPLTAV